MFAYKNVKFCSASFEYKKSANGQKRNTELISFGEMATAVTKGKRGR